jgi:MOSC domain-containing protein YiiM
MERVICGMGAGFALGLGRRNIVSRAAELEALNGRPFREGEAACGALSFGSPWRYLARPITLRVRTDAKGCGGIRVEFLKSGWIRKEDPMILEKRGSTSPGRSGA